MHCEGRVREWDMGGVLDGWIEREMNGGRDAPEHRGYKEIVWETGRERRGGAGGEGRERI